MAGLYRPDDPFEVYSAHDRAYVIILRATTSSSAAPDGAEPDQNVTWARVSDGSYTAVISTGAPLEVLHGEVNIEGGIASVAGTYQFGRYTGYTAASGTVAVEIGEMVSGTNVNPVLSNVDNLAFSVKLYCRRT